MSSKAATPTEKQKAQAFDALRKCELDVLEAYWREGPDGLEHMARKNRAARKHIKALLEYVLEKTSGI